MKIRNITEKEWFQYHKWLEDPGGSNIMWTQEQLEETKFVDISECVDPTTRIDTWADIDGLNL